MLTCSTLLLKEILVFTLVCKINPHKGETKVVIAGKLSDRAAKGVVKNMIEKIKKGDYIKRFDEANLSVALEALGGEYEDSEYNLSLETAIKVKIKKLAC